MSLLQSFFFFISIFPFFCLVHVRILALGEKLYEGDSLKHRYCELILRPDGNLIVERHGVPIWSSEDMYISHRHGGNKFFAEMKRNGDFIVKARGEDPIFKTYTYGANLNYHSGGLYMKGNCDIVIADDFPFRIIWSNIRTTFNAGNRLRKGEMFVYPEWYPMYTLLLQHDGNLVVFRGENMSDLHGPHNVLFSADIHTHQNEFFLQLNCDGLLVLREKIGGHYVIYWSMRLLPHDFNKSYYRGYSLTLSNHGIGHPEPLFYCDHEWYTA